VVEPRRLVRPRQRLKKIPGRAAAGMYRLLSDAILPRAGSRPLQIATTAILVLLACAPVAARAQPSASGHTLRAPPVLRDESNALGRGGDARLALTLGFINNWAMDMGRVDEVAALETTKIWQIEKLVGMDHPLHLHGYRFQVLDRNGVPEPYASWKDTVNVPSHAMVRIAMPVRGLCRQVDVRLPHPGPRANGMMS
jgi:FtsP/CotA-like multicopper oxidase with cupredoxin domain